MVANINWQRGCFGIFLVLIAGLWAVLYAVAPLQFDDFWFLPDGWTGMGFVETLTEGFRRSFYLCTHTDAGRFVNFICAPFLAIPRWLFGLLTAGCIWLLLRLTSGLSGASRGSALSYLSVFAVVFVLPWYDYMLSTVFALNYVWSSALVLGVVMFLVRRLDGERFGRNAWLLAILFFVAGWSHEGLSVPVIAGVCMAFVLLRRMPDRLTCVLLVCFALGIAMIAFSVFRRVGVAEMGYMRYRGMELIAHLVMSNAVSVVFLLLLAWTFISKKLRQKFMSSSFRSKFIVIMSLGAVVTGSLVNMLFYIAPRTAWGPILFGIIGSLQLVRISGFSLSSVARKTVSATAAACVIFNLGAAVCEQTKLTAEFDDIKRMYEASGDGVIYYDNIRPKLTPALFKTSVRCFNQRHPLTSFALGFEPHYPLTILPAAVRDFNAADADRAMSWPEARLYRGYVVIGADACPDAQFVTITDSRGNLMESRYRLLPFTDAHGERWQLLLPHVQLMSDGVVEVADITDPDLRP